MDVSKYSSAFLADLEDLPSELVAAIRNASNSQFLASLSTYSLQPRWTQAIFSAFEPIALELCSRWPHASTSKTIPALGRILPVSPRLQDLAMSRIVDDDNRVDLLSGLPYDNSQESTELAKEILHGVARLMLFDNQTFAPLLQPARLQVFLQHENRSIRYLAIRILVSYLHASDAALKAMIAKYLGDGEVTGTWEDKIIDYRFWPLWEDRRLKSIRAQSHRIHESSPHASLPAQRILCDLDFSPMIARVADRLFFRKSNSPVSDSPDDYVQTMSTAANLTAFAHALEKPEPILITGLTGSGKTHLMNHVSRRLGQSTEMITLHLNEQSDAKLLIGIYASGPKPGTFEWRPGVLTAAVQKGYWVLIEDLDRAPIDILSTIIPLIERREIVISSRGETIKAATNFRVFATIRSHLNLRGEEQVNMPRMPGGRLWNRLQLLDMNSDDLVMILLRKFPNLEDHVPRIIATYESVRLEGSRMAPANRSLSLRPASSRDLFKWSERLARALRRHQNGNQKTVSEDFLDLMFLDAFDCFAGHLSLDEARGVVAAVIARELHIDPQRRDHLLSDRQIPLNQGTISNGLTFRVGRLTLEAKSKHKKPPVQTSSAPFATNRHTLKLLERIAVSVDQAEPVLLVGETGIGKTTAVQHLSTALGRRLVAINLSQQSESSDLLGGYKPLNLSSLAVPLKDEFDDLFERTFSQTKNQKYLQMLAKCISRAQWRRAATLWREALRMVEQALQTQERVSAQIEVVGQVTKRRKTEHNSKIVDKIAWDAFTVKLIAFEKHVNSTSGDSMIFSFVEGKLVDAVREGHWVLLDEINLATPDTLECLSELLEAGPDAARSIVLAETGSTERIKAHPDFRIFAAMNPSNDVGKKDLPTGIKSRFTEYYVDSPDKDLQSLQVIVRAYLSRASQSSADSKLSNLVAQMYLDIQKTTKEEGLVDGANQPPVFSLRTLSRALTHATTILDQCSLKRAIFEGFALCFFTSLDGHSETLLQDLVRTRLFGSVQSSKSELQKPLRASGNHAQFMSVSLRVENVDLRSKSREEQQWLPRGENAPENPETYIITPYIFKNLQNLIRAASTRKYPVLIQGPTSAGKTSMVEHLAKRSGNTFVRINNHEHTDLQEYLGTYISSSEGKIVFQEGVLVEALRKGYWVVLDELNLAPTDVLEALNRLLDDNRELLIPETQEIVRPHPNFMLFATQNPAGPYGGRKVLSRAFRNRFVELHFDDIPVEELNIILARRSSLPESWCKLIVNVYKELSRLRQTSRVFESNSFATLRDLFRWAFRGADTVQELATQGYMLLAEKVRSAAERQQVKHVLETSMTRKGTVVRIDETQLYAGDAHGEIKRYGENASDDIVWTGAMRRLYTLVVEAIRHNEPVLLVGETGCGKTTVCQMIAQACQKKLHIVNAHQNMETGDLIGAQRPRRNRAAVETQLQDSLVHALSACGRAYDVGTQSLDELTTLLKGLSTEETKDIPPQLMSKIANLQSKAKVLFEWQDGSIVSAMKSGDFFLLDEISLADDSVLERLNSVLDPQRNILLAEKGAQDANVAAAPGFQFFATMNPGGDFGKKELSPALRNRFTEIWVPSMSDDEDISLIVQSKLCDAARSAAQTILDFGKWFEAHFRPLKESSISLRDMLAWVEFINHSSLGLNQAIMEGARMVYIDTLGANPSAMMAVSSSALKHEKSVCVQRLQESLSLDPGRFSEAFAEFSFQADSVKFGPFAIQRFESSDKSFDAFSFTAPTTRNSALRIARGLQLRKPLLLEGNPGVGKTSIVTSLAKAIGKPLVRLNLSEQTDLMDLFGSDAPVEDAPAGIFAWRDAPFLSAMKRGDWVLLDEMNLASQSVLEGLNACLDHRAAAYVAELDQTFHRHPDFRLFAAQNPHSQGGGRKGLPASFVNRFTVIYMDVLEHDDLASICKSAAPMVEEAVVNNLIDFVTTLDQDVVTHRKLGLQGSPWEFNLRDCLRCLQLLTATDGLLQARGLELAIDMLFVQRFRTTRDSSEVAKMAGTILNVDATDRSLFLNVTPDLFQVGAAVLPRHEVEQGSYAIPRLQAHAGLRALEALSVSVMLNWPVLLIGPSGSGKSCLINSAAAAIGATVDVFSLSADIDASDLVGGFEQVDKTRYEYRFRIMLAAAAEKDAIAILAEPATGQRNTIFDEMIGLLKLLSFAPCDELLNYVARSTPLVDCADVINVCQAFRHIVEDKRAGNEARFEWVDGTLVKALEAGHWLVLDNANLCSPSVLDRLNSLLEPGGSLIINEHCNPDGSPRIVKPHPKFRLFLTMDPQYGEISRAMRNRTVELFISPAYSEKPTCQCESRLESDLTRFDDILRMLDANDSRGAANNYMQDAMLERLAFEDMKLVKSFASQLESGLLHIRSENVPACVEACQMLLQTATENQSWYAHLLQNLRGILEKHRMSDSQALFQPLHASKNEALVLLAPESCLPTLALSHEALCSVSRMAGILAQTDDISTSKATLKNSPKSRCKAFLQAVLHLIYEWASHPGLDDPLLPQSRLISFATVLWSRLADILPQSIDDSSTIDAILQHSRGWLETRIETDGASPLSRMLLQEVEKFGQSKASRYGRAMNTIWTLLRPNTPSTIEQLHLRLQLETIASKFDDYSKSLQVPLQDMIPLRSSILSAFDLCAGWTFLNGTRIEAIDQTIPMLSDGTEQPPLLEASFRRSSDYLMRGVLLDHQLGDLEFLRPLQMLSSIKLATVATMRTSTGPSRHLQDISALSRLLCRKTTLLNTPQAILQDLRAVPERSLESLSRLRDEMAFIGKAIGVHPEALTTDTTMLLSRHLNSVAQAIIGASSTTAEQSVLDLAEKMRSELNGSQNFKQAQSATERDMKLSRTLTVIATCCILLYVPEIAADPALANLIAADFHGRQREHLQHQIEAKSMVEAALTGSQRNLDTRLIQAQIEDLGSAPDSVQIYRPRKPRIGELQSYFTNALRIAEKTLRTCGQQTIPQFEEGLAEDLEQMIDRLENFDPAYFDITKPLVGFLDCLRLASRLSLHAVESRGDSNHTNLQEHLVSATPLCSTRSHSASATILPRGFESDHKKIADGIHVLNFVAFRRQIDGQDSPMSPDQAEAIAFGLGIFYEQWQKQLKRDQKAAEEASSTYTYRGNLEDGDEPTDEDVAHMFISSHAQAHCELTSLSPKQMAVTVARQHLSIFEKPREAADCLEGLILDAMDSGSTSMSSDLHAAEDLVPAAHLKFAEQSRRITSSSSTKYNIFADSNVTEIARLAQSASEIKTRTEDIQKVWPEQATLQTIIDNCNHIQQMLWTQPIMMYLPLVEALHASLAQWQSVASREYTLADMFERITQTIISWRRLELSTWSSLLEVEETRIKEQAYEWWFPVYENVILAPFSDPETYDALAQLPHLVSPLLEFLAGTTIGQFQHRITLLRSLHTHLSLSSGDDEVKARVADAVQNVIDDLARHEPAVEKSILTKKSDLEKEVKDVILLASWKDTNVEALKQSSRVSHRKLFRIVRKFQDFLGKPVSPIIMPSSQSDALKDTNREDGTSSAASLLKPVISQGWAATVSLSHVESWSQRPVRFQKTLPTLTMMHKKLGSFLNVSSASTAISDFAEKIEASARELRQETPSTSTTENAAEIRHSTAQKRRLFAEALRGLRLMGLSSNQNPATLRAQDSKAKVLAQLPARKKTGEPTLAHSDDFFQTLDLAPQIRGSLNDFHQDVTQDDMARSVGLFEGMFAVGIDSTKRAFTHDHVLGNLQSCLRQLQGTFSQEGPTCSILDKEDRSLTAACQTIKPVLQVAIKVLESQASLGELDFSRLTEQLHRFVTVFESLSQRAKSMQTIPHRLISDEASSLSAETRSSFDSLKNSLAQAMVEFPPAKIVLQHAIRWADIGRLADSASDQPAEDAAIRLTKFNDDLFELLDACLSATQDVEKASHDGAFSVDDKGWLVRAARFHGAILAAFNGVAISASCQALASQMHLLRDNKDLSLAIASLSMGLPLLEMYHTAYRAAVAQAQTFNESLWSSQAKLGRLFCTVSSQGFCKPAEPSDEKGEQSEKLDEGTGLGEGEGAENISKDIGEDEDLSELAQEENEGAKQEQQDGDDNDAVDVDEDVKNALGEEERAGDEEEDSKEEKGDDADEDEDGDQAGGDDTNAAGTEGQDEGDENLDEGVGDVDELEPSAVDEKMWDEAGDNEKEDEKEARQDGKNKSDEQAASKEDARKDHAPDDGEEGSVSGGSDAEEDDEGGEEDTEEGQEKGAMDPYAQDADALELPEDMQLDGDKQDDADKDETGSDQEMLDEVDEEMPDEEPAAEPDADGKEADEAANEQEPAVDETTHEDDSTAVLDHNVNDGGLSDAEDDITGGQSAQTQGKRREDKADVADPDPTVSNERQDASAEQEEQGEQGADAAEQARGPSKSSKAEPSEQQAREREQMQRLGDMLEKWHRQHRDIQPASEDQGQQEQQDVDMADADLEHLEDEEAQPDTQALGASTQEQARALNPDNALLPDDDGDNAQDPQPDTFRPDEAEDEDENNDEAMPDVDADAPSLDALVEPSTLSRSTIHTNALEPPSSPTPSPPPSPSLAFRLPPPTSVSSAHSYADYDRLTAPLSAHLLASLRLILPATLATRLHGDYRTGKRLNLKRIIPFLASSYKRDKIWLRRALPSKRTYAVLLALDDSKSMAPFAPLALASLTTVLSALARLDVGQLGVLGFGDTAFDALPLDAPFSPAAAQHALDRFAFAQPRTDVERCVRAMLDRFDDARARARAGADDLWQLGLLVSDGVCEGHERLRRLLLDAAARRVLLVFVIVDGAAGQSITELERVEFVPGPAGADGRPGPPRVLRSKYLDTFPFGYYLVVRDVQDLPGVLSQALRQWFAEVAGM